MGKATEPLVGIVFASGNQHYYKLILSGQANNFLRKRIADGDAIKEISPLEKEVTIRAFIGRAAQSLGSPEPVAG